MARDFDSYGWDQLHRAVETLASSAGPRQDVIRDVFFANLQRIDPDRNLPAPLRESFREFVAMLDREIRREGFQPNGFLEVRNEVATELASRIVGFYDRTTRYRDPLDED